MFDTLFFLCTHIYKYIAFMFFFPAVFSKLFVQRSILTSLSLPFILCDSTSFPLEQKGSHLLLLNPRSRWLSLCEQNRSKLCWQNGFGTYFLSCQADWRVNENSQQSFCYVVVISCYRQVLPVQSKWIDVKKQNDEMTPWLEAETRLSGGWGNSVVTAAQSNEL
jgi:hypothetical protein